MITKVCRLRWAQIKRVSERMQQVKQEKELFSSLISKHYSGKKTKKILLVALSLVIDDKLYECLQNILKQRVNSVIAWWYRGDILKIIMWVSDYTIYKLLKIILLAFGTGICLPMGFYMYCCLWKYDCIPLVQLCFKGVFCEQNIHNYVWTYSTNLAPKKRNILVLVFCNIVY